MKQNNHSIILAVCISVMLISCGDDNAVIATSNSELQGQWWYGTSSNTETTSETYMCFNSNGVAYEVTKRIYSYEDQFELDLRWYKGTHTTQGDSLTIDLPEKVVFGKMDDTTTSDIQLINGTFRGIGENDTYRFTVSAVQSQNTLTLSMPYNDQIMSLVYTKATTLPSYMNGITCE